MNMEENRSIWQYLEFPEICHAEHFSDIDPNELEDDAKWKSDQHERCAEFQAIRFRVKYRPKRSTEAPEKAQFLKGT
jgi:hypothetical protein